MSLFARERDISVKRVRALLEEKTFLFIIQLSALGVIHRIICKIISSRFTEKWRKYFNIRIIND